MSSSSALCALVVVVDMSFLINNSLMANDGEHLFVHLLAQIFSYCLLCIQPLSFSNACLLLADVLGPKHLTFPIINSECTGEQSDKMPLSDCLRGEQFTLSQYFYSLT